MLFTFLPVFSLLPPSTSFHSTHEMTCSGARLCWPGKFASSKRNTELRPHGVKVKAPMIWVFPHVTTICHCRTSSEQEDAEALFTSQLCPLSFTSKPPTLPQSRDEQTPVCSLLLRDLPEKSYLLALLRLGTTKNSWRVSAGPAVFVSACNCTQSRLQHMQSHFSSAVLSFSEQYCFFWQITCTITSSNSPS